jgi:hypothetical protein
MDDYQSALALEKTGCCVTKMEYATTAFGENIVSFFIVFIQWIQLLHDFVSFMCLSNKWILWNQSGIRWCQSYFQSLKVGR